jgi:hypothetical protein
MLVQHVSTWIWNVRIVLFMLAAITLFACQPMSDSAGTEVSVITTFPPQTPKSNMDDPSNTCRIRDELPFGDVTTLSLPEIDPQALQEEDQNQPKDAPLRFATSTEVNVDAAEYGQWAATGDQTDVWRIRILSPGALSLSLGFTAFSMPKGGCLFLYAPDQSQVIGPYTQADNAEHRQLWTPTIDGEEVMIEVSLPKNQKSAMQLVLGFINQGFKK